MERSWMDPRDSRVWQVRGYCVTSGTQVFGGPTRLGPQRRISFQLLGGGANGSSAFTAEIGLEEDAQQFTDVELMELLDVARGN